MNRLRTFIAIDAEGGLHKVAEYPVTNRRQTRDQATPRVPSMKSGSAYFRVDEAHPAVETTTGEIFCRKFGFLRPKR